MWSEYLPAKEAAKSELTCIRYLLVYLSREKRDSFTLGVRSTYILGLQIGSILSRLTAVALAKAVHSDQD
jgi:tetrahydromethanopterin S-methyltransferase subunit F